LPILVDPRYHPNLGRCIELRPGPHVTRQHGPMQNVVLYTTRFCPYCAMAKRLLVQKGATFEEIDVGGNPGLREEMARKAGGRRTVPQIWIGETHVGGCQELYELEAAGELDALLAGSAA
jgi:glutaredoxin 3